MLMTLMTWGGPHTGPWFLVFPFLWLLLIGLVVFAFRGGWRGRRPWHAESGESILGERFAKGEITAEEYRERLDVLRRKG